MPGVFEVLIFFCSWPLVCLCVYAVARLAGVDCVRVAYGVFLHVRGGESVVALLRRLRGLGVLWPVAVAFGYVALFVVPVPTVLFVPPGDAPPVDVVPSLIAQAFLKLWIRFVQGVEGPSPKLVPIIPGVTFDWSLVPYLGAAIALCIALHELFHGAFAVAKGVKVKGGGLFAAFYIFCGAYVELDEKSFSEVNLRRKAAVVSAGILANLLILYAVAAIAFGIYAFAPSVAGVEVIDVFEGGPSYGILHPGDRIVAVDGTPVINVNYLLYELSKHSPGDKVQVLAIDKSGELKTLTIVLGEHPKRKGAAYMGVLITDTPIMRLLSMTYMISLTLILLNALPAMPLDGGKLVYETLKSLCSEKVADTLAAVLTTLSVLAIITLFI